jgi:hypothetical protein
MKTAYLLLALAIATALPGCACVAMTCHDAAAWTSRHWSAEKAWRERKWMYADIPCRGSFKTGFKAGYRFANGGYDSCEPPALRHYWRIGGLTESERQNAQAWSDGFTHGTVAAQQDHAVGQSAFETAAMQAPPGVPDVRYFTPPQPNAMDQSDNVQFSPSMPPPTPYEVPQTENFRNAPMTAPPPPAPPSEAVPAQNNLSPPRVTLPPPPSSVPAPNVRPLPAHMPVSEGSPGIGSLGTLVRLQPAPAVEPGPTPFSPEQAGSPPRQATQAADWQLPIIRD